jgi:hypothetical protein
MDDSADNEVDKIHIDMWMHYDNLRQKKNGTFLTANTILAAIVGLSGKDSGLGAVVAGIAGLGIILGAAWFMLLRRNSAYIALHRTAIRGVGSLAPQAGGPLRSAVLDGSLPVAFVIFWAALLLQRLVSPGSS